MSRFGIWGMMLLIWLLANPALELAAGLVAAIPDAGSVAIPRLWMPPPAVLLGLLLAFLAGEIYCAWCDCRRL